METILKAKTQELLKEKVEQYLKTYPPAGYGTKVNEKAYYDEKQGFWCIKANRESSCD